jgi:Cys-rich repeat protein
VAIIPKSISRIRTFRSSRAITPQAALLVALSVLLSASSCVNDDGKGAEPEDPKTAYGRFYVSMLGPGPWAADTQVTFVGQLFDGPSPATRVWDEQSREGDCLLITPRTPFCDPGCGSAVCVEGGICMAYPKALGAGKVTVSGMKTQSGAGAFTMNPLLGVYQPAGILFDDRPFTESDTVAVSVAGGNGVPAFSLRTRGLSIPEILDDSIILDGRTVRVRWTPLDASARFSPMVITLDASHHGGIKGLVECVTEDDGETDIAGSLVTQLKELGLSGYPHIQLLRRSSGAAETQAVNLTIEAWNLRYVTVPGLVSCTENAECPSGQTCQPDKKCL